MLIEAARRLATPQVRLRVGDKRPRRERRVFKQEYDDGPCKCERKLEKSGEYKEEVKSRRGRRGPYPGYGYRY